MGPDTYARKVFEGIRSGLLQSYDDADDIYVLPSTEPAPDVFTGIYSKAFRAEPLDEMFRQSARRGHPIDVVITSDFRFAESCRKRRIKTDVRPYLWERKDELFWSQGRERRFADWKRSDRQFFEEDLELASMIDSFLLIDYLHRKNVIHLGEPELRSALETLVDRFRHFSENDPQERTLPVALERRLEQAPVGDVQALRALLVALLEFYSNFTGPVDDPACREEAERLREAAKVRYEN